MTVTINGDEVPLSLEQEKTARDVVSGLAAWLEDQAWEILSVRLDGEDFFANPATRDRPVEAMGRLEIQARDWKAQAQDELSLLQDFFGHLLTAAQTGDRDQVRPLIAQYQGLRPSLVNRFGHIKGRTGLWVGFDSVNQAVDDDNSDLRLLSEGAKILREGFGLLLEERLEPEVGFNNSLQRLAVLIPNVRDVSLKLQLGQDREAMNVLLVLLSILEDLTRQWTFLVKIKSAQVQVWEAQVALDPLFSELNGFLKEVVTAFESKDFILVGDLLEYEISPRLDSFVALRNP